MEKKKLTVKQKKRILLIATFITVFVVGALFVFRFVIQPKNVSSYTTNIEDTKKLSGVFIVPDFVETSEYTIDTQKCAENVCILSIVIEYYGDRGIITYVIENHNARDISSNLRVTLDGKKFTFPYRLSANATGTFYYGYDGYDFKFNNFGGFSVESGGSEDLNSMYENMPESERPSIQVN